MDTWPWIFSVVWLLFAFLYKAMCLISLNWDGLDHSEFTGWQQLLISYNTLLIALACDI